jgi:hypothetical protein
MQNTLGKPDHSLFFVRLINISAQKNIWQNTVKYILSGVLLYILSDILRTSEKNIFRNLKSDHPLERRERNMFKKNFKVELRIFLKNILQHHNSSTFPYN